MVVGNLDSWTSQGLGGKIELRERGIRLEGQGALMRTSNVCGMGSISVTNTELVPGLTMQHKLPKNERQGAHLVLRLLPASESEGIRRHAQPPGLEQHSRGSPGQPGLGPWMVDDWVLCDGRLQTNTGKQATMWDEEDDATLWGPCIQSRMLVRRLGAR